MSLSAASCVTLQCDRRFKCVAVWDRFYFYFFILFFLKGRERGWATSHRPASARCKPEYTPEMNHTAKDARERERERVVGRLERKRSQ